MFSPAPLRPAYNAPHRSAPHRTACPGNSPPLPPHCTALHRTAPHVVATPPPPSTAWFAGSAGGRGQRGHQEWAAVPPHGRGRAHGRPGDREAGIHEGAAADVAAMAGAPPSPAGHPRENSRESNRTSLFFFFFNVRSLFVFSLSRFVLSFVWPGGCVAKWTIFAGASSRTRQHLPCHAPTILSYPVAHRSLSLSCPPNSLIFSFRPPCLPPSVVSFTWQDFYVEMKWNFSAAFLMAPLMQAVAPSDTYR